MKSDQMSRDALPTGEDALTGTAEDWEPWESTLVGLSVTLGVAGLVGLGWLVDHFILP